VHQRILRTIDANINRVSEGLRVLEDISRFVIEDPEFSRQLKSVRHMLNQSAASMGQVLLKNRDAARDIGAGSDLTYDHKDITSMVRANAKRVEEGLRVLEELSKLPEIKDLLPTGKIKDSRYLVYSIEKALVLQLAERISNGGAANDKKTKRR
jgi:thiamine-phosphate pyrophosphorylase